MRKLVDSDSASLPTASTGGGAPQQSEIVSRGNRTCGSKVGTPPPQKTWDPKQGEEEYSEGTREYVCKSVDKANPSYSVLA